MDKYFWTQEDFETLAKAKTMPELLSLAISILKRMPQPVSLISGPISTGGAGDLKRNLERFADAIAAVHKKGEVVFNQLPFEDAFGELAKKSSLPYFQPILDDFFLPIFKSGMIRKIYFMPNWESSTGAQWEYEIGGKLGIERVRMPESMLQQTL